MQKSNQKEIFTENCRLVRGKKGTLMKRVAEIKRTTGLALVSFFRVLHVTGDRVSCFIDLIRVAPRVYARLFREAGFFITYTYQREKKED